ncbi:HrpE/YscL family type III secretion apparatus protein [Candidatus Regiella endosymbiont of Tuberolachnus salignus]|uniref:HrpE/YscL family type III secretion apparatus protein n=1 Tax=Candidatus Regiella endosymbiont of Tuberolachnus salignus TaxID=3077956 RepID=UPI0030D000DC
MLKLTPLTAHEGVLLTRAQVTGQRQAKNILSEACLHAKKMIKQAGSDAEKIKKQAYAEGYQQGVITAAKQIKKYINASHELSEKLNTVLVKRAKEILSTALDHPDILIILVDEWLHKLDKESVINDNLLHLILPLSAKKRHVQLLEFLNENWNKPIKIEYHAESRLIIKYVDQIAEFVPDEFIEQGLTRLSLTNDVIKECRTLSQNALQQLSDLFQKSFSATE